jgi:RHS repeat-associated protein
VPPSLTVQVGSVDVKREAAGACRSTAGAPAVGVKVATAGRYYVVANGRPVAELVQTGAYYAVQEQVHYLHTDVRGSVELVTDESGNAVGKRSYDVWGRLPSQPPQSYLRSANVEFTGQEDELDLGLVNLNGRIYDPRLGRFTTPDPFLSTGRGAQALNRYSYVENNPTSLIDPSGFQTWTGTAWSWPEYYNTYVFGSWTTTEVEGPENALYAPAVGEYGDAVGASEAFRTLLPTGPYYPAHPSPAPAGAPGGQRSQHCRVQGWV